AGEESPNLSFNPKITSGEGVEKEVHGPAYKPGSVPRRARRRSFLFSAGCPAAQATYPRVVTGRTSPAPIFGLAPGGVCRASLSPGCWWALTLRDRNPPTISPLPRNSG